MAYTREQYLTHPAVSAFVDRLTDLICAGPGSFVQSYQPDSGRDPFFQVERFVDACHTYHFAGKGLDETAEQLAALSAALRQALADRDDTAALKASLRVYGWGGVLNDASVAWLVDAHDREDLAEMLIGATAAVTGDHEDKASEFQNHVPWRSDSATTKLFAMADPMSAIYDNRVAAGIGWLVVEHCDRRGMREVPEPLRFRVQGGAATNPSRGTLRMPTRQPGLGSDHALSNLRFNWILGELAARDQVVGAFELGNDAEVVRAIEAALFMIGKRFDAIRMPPWPDGNGEEIGAAA